MIFLIDSRPILFKKQEMMMGYGLGVNFKEFI